jgi:hypothetical protein
MTALGATVYVGFFVLAALWLFVTRDTGEVYYQPDEAELGIDHAVDGTQVPVRSNSEMVSAGPAGSK